MTIAMTIIAVLLAEVLALPVAVVVAGVDPGVLAGSLFGWPGSLGAWGTDLPALVARLGHLAGALWWPWTSAAAAAVVLVSVAVRLARRVAWRRSAAGGYWVAITVPRTVDAARWGLVWRRLSGLAAAARGGRWRLARPPLAFELYRQGRVLTVGLWLPGWVPYAAVAGEVAHAWPGCTVQRVDPPALHAGDGRGGVVAGVRLAVDSLHSQAGWLVDDARPRPAMARPALADPVLDGVLSALAEPGGPVLLQVLVRPATRRRLAWLAAAGRHPVQARRAGWRYATDGLLWLMQAALRAVADLVELVLTTGSAHPSGRVSAREAAPDAVDREAMAEARAKLADRPHLLVTVRVGATSARRAQAQAAARSVADGYSEASRWLRPVRLAGAQAAMRLRRARRSEWLLLSANELGVLAHLPPDPALYRLAVAALHRAAPAGVAHPAAERPGPTWPGWNRSGWTTPPTDTNKPSAVPAGRTMPYVADDHSDELSTDEGEP